LVLYQKSIDACGTFCRQVSGPPRQQLAGRPHVCFLKSTNYQIQKQYKKLFVCSVRQQARAQARCWVGGPVGWRVMSNLMSQLWPILRIDPLTVSWKCECVVIYVDYLLESDEHFTIGLAYKCVVTGPMASSSSFLAVEQSTDACLTVYIYSCQACEGICKWVVFYEFVSMYEYYLL